MSGISSGLGVKLTSEPGGFENRECEAWNFVYSKFTNNIVSEVNFTSELGPSMNSVLLRWTPSLNIRSKLKGQRKAIKFGSDASYSLVSSLAPHAHIAQSQFEHFSRDTVPLTVWIHC